MAGIAPNKKTTRRAIGIKTDDFLVMASPNETPENSLALAFDQATVRPSTEIPSSTLPQHSLRSTGNMDGSVPTASPDVASPMDTLALAFSRRTVRRNTEVPSTAIPQHSLQSQKLQCEREQLPVWQYKDEFLELMETNQVIITEGETGCGKTTQIPQWSVAYTKRKQAVACTQPRRVAASSIAMRVAAEMDVKVGEEVGYHIRFENCTSAKTVLTYMTEGILLRHIASNPLLEGYGVILLDECHERGVFADVLMGLLEDIVRRRHDLRLIIMSATINKRRFREYFGYPPVLSIPGRLHMITIVYSLEDEWDFVKSAVTKVKYIHQIQMKQGDILIFAPGLEHIDKICGELKSWVKSSTYRFGKLWILPFYSSLPKEEQDLVFEPAPPDDIHGISRKVIVATNIAETSITINGVIFVIDCGFMNMKIYNRQTRVEHIMRVRTTQTNARQRAGRAGRTQPGVCYRLYTEDTYDMMEPYIQPEVKRSNLSSIVLDLKNMRFEDPVCFNFMDPPDIAALDAALTELRQLKALDRKHVITQLGKRMAEFPIDPRVAKVLVKSWDYNCQEEILTIAAMLTVPPCFIWNRKRCLEINECRKQFISAQGDHIMLLKLYNAYRANGENEKWCRRNFVHHRHLKSAVGIRSELQAILQKLCLYVKNYETHDGPEYINTRKAIISGFCMQVALKGDPGYRTLFDPETAVEINSSSGLTERPQYVIYHERYTTNKHYIGIVTPIKSSWWNEVVGLSVDELKLQ